MNFKGLLSIAAAGLVMASCSTPSGAPESGDSGLSKADSLIYFFGQMRGSEYNQTAEKDSTLADPEARKQFVRGVKAGIDAVKAEKEAYNRGLFLGMQMAMTMQQFKEDYGYNLSSRVFLQSLSETVNADTVLNPNEIQSNFYRVMGELNEEKEQKENEEASAALAKAATAEKMVELSENLWGTKSDKGDKIKTGDKVNINLAISTLDGKSVDSPFPRELTLGERMNNSPVVAAILTLSSGEEGNFLTTARALFGARCAQFGLKPADVLKLKLTATVAAEPAAGEGEE